MKKRSAKKLSLGKETVRILSEKLPAVAGGSEGEEDTRSRPCTISCHND